jgi:hypothetical protein
MALADDLERIAGAAAAGDDRVVGVLAAELLDGSRVYLCAFESGAWLALDAAASPVPSAQAVHEAASLAALCEVAEESAGGGHLPELRARLGELGLEEAGVAAAELEAAIQPPPRVATNAYLDALGAASRRLEQALGDEAGSPFAVALQQALPAVEELAAQVTARHKTPLH